jgi:hypothetical protein
MVPSRKKPKARLEANTPQCPNCKAPMMGRILLPRRNFDAKSVLPNAPRSSPNRADQR